MVKKSIIPKKTKEDKTLFYYTIAILSVLVIVAFKSDSNPLALAFWAVVGGIVLLDYEEKRKEKIVLNGAKATQKTSVSANTKLSAILTKLLVIFLMLVTAWLLFGMLLFAK